MGIPTLNKISNAIWGTTTAPTTSYTVGPSTYGCGSSGTISTAWIYASSSICSYSITGGPGNYQTPAIPEAQQRIEITFKDGGTTILPLKDYTIFVALHGKSPSECTKQEYEELSFGERV